MENLLVIRPVTVLLRDIMPKPKICSEQQKRIEAIRRVVHTYNSAHLPVSQYFKRIAASTKNHDEIFDICEIFHKTVNIPSMCRCFFVHLFLFFFIFIFIFNWTLFSLAVGERPQIHGNVG